MELIQVAVVFVDDAAELVTWLVLVVDVAVIAAVTVDVVPVLVFVDIVVGVAAKVVTRAGIDAVVLVILFVATVDDETNNPVSLILCDAVTFTIPGVFTIVVTVRMDVISAVTLVDDFVGVVADAVVLAIVYVAVVEGETNNLVALVLCGAVTFTIPGVLAIVVFARSVAVAVIVDDGVGVTRVTIAIEVVVIAVVAVDVITVLVVAGEVTDGVAKVVTPGDIDTVVLAIAFVPTVDGETSNLVTLVLCDAVTFTIPGVLPIVVIARMDVVAVVLIKRDGVEVVIIMPDVVVDVVALTPVDRDALVFVIKRGLVVERDSATVVVVELVAIVPLVDVVRIVVVVWGADIIVLVGLIVDDVDVVLVEDDAHSEAVIL